MVKNVVIIVLLLFSLLFLFFFFLVTCLFHWNKLRFFFSPPPCLKNKKKMGFWAYVMCVCVFICLPLYMHAPCEEKKKMENSSFSASNSTRLPARLAATVQIHCLRKAEEEAAWPTNQSVMRRLEEGKGKKERHVRFTFSAYPFHCCVYLFFFFLPTLDFRQ